MHSYKVSIDSIHSPQNREDWLSQPKRLMTQHLQAQCFSSHKIRFTLLFNDFGGSKPHAHTIEFKCKFQLHIDLKNFSVQQLPNGLWKTCFDLQYRKDHDKYLTIVTCHHTSRLVPEVDNYPYPIQLDAIHSLYSAQDACSRQYAEQLYQSLLTDWNYLNDTEQALMCKIHETFRQQSPPIIICQPQMCSEAPRYGTTQGHYCRLKTSAHLSITSC